MAIGETLYGLGKTDPSYEILVQSGKSPNYIQFYEFHTGSKPTITEGQRYASAALVGAGCYALFHDMGVGEGMAEAAAFTVGVLIRAATIIFDIRMGPTGEFIPIGPPDRSGMND